MNKQNYELDQNDVFMLKQMLRSYKSFVNDSQINEGQKEETNKDVDYILEKFN